MRKILTNYADRHAVQDPIQALGFLSDNYMPARPHVGDAFLSKLHSRQEVVFSNDGPLCGSVEAANQLPQIFAGAWLDLNSIGSNGGMATPSISSLLRLITGPVGYAKFFAPVSLFILGIGAWAFFRQLKLTALATILGALAAVLTSTLFSDACWGVASHQIAFGMDFLAMALIVSNSPATPWFVGWVRFALAGFAVGITVVEAADIGAIFSLFVAAFALFQSLVEDGTPVKKIGRGVGRITVITAFAAFFAYQTVISLVGTQIEGIVGMGQSDADKAAHWDYATEWSLPKIETFGIIVPGLFGYRMDTPDGGAYWGAVGRNPGWDRYLASGENGSPPPPPLRFYGTGNYAGTLVLLVALWAIAQSLRRKDSVFSTTHRQFLWFWTAVLLVSVLLAFGRFAPFYALLYKLPYFSTIRNPVKFLFVFSWALVTVFAYGIHGLSRRYLEIPATGSASPLGQLKVWWTKIRGFDRNWTSTCFVVFIGSLLVWLIYALQRPNLATYLQMVGFPDEGGTKGMANIIAAFSIRQIGWFILFFVLAMGLLTLILSGAFAGRRGKCGGILLGTCLFWIWGVPTCLGLSIGITRKNMPAIPSLISCATDPMNIASPFCTPTHSSRISTASNGPSRSSLITTSSRWMSFRCRVCPRIWRRIKQPWRREARQTRHTLSPAVGN